MLRYKNINLDRNIDNTSFQKYENEQEVFNDLEFIIGDYRRYWDKISNSYNPVEYLLEDLCDYVHDKCEYYYDKVDNYHRYTDKQYYYNKAQLKKHTINYVCLQLMNKFYE